MINKYCKLYSPILGASITRRGREYISMTALTTEGVMNGYFPKKYEALIYVIEEIKKEDNPFYKDLHEEIFVQLKNNSQDETSDHKKLLVQKVIDHIGTGKDYYMYDALKNRLENESIKTLIKIYYKNNLKAFINLPKVKDIFQESMKILNDDKRVVGKISNIENDIVKLEEDYVGIDPDKKYIISDALDLNQTNLDLLVIEEVNNNGLKFDGYNPSNDDIGKHIIDCSSVFIDPYKPPEGIMDRINNLSHMVETILYGHYWYGGDYIEEKNITTPNQQETIKSIDRMSVLLIDTDSNCLSIEDLNNTIDDLFGDILSNFNNEEKWFTLSNLSTVIAVTAIDYSLERYKDHINIPLEYRERMNMKNEYLFRRFLLTSRKKNYIGTIKLKEGGVYRDPKLDTKGLSFTKSNFNKELCDNVEGIVDNIMMEECIDVQNVLLNLREIDEKVAEELSSDDAIKYFDIEKISDDPEDLPIHDHRVNAVRLWNFIGNGQEIEMPSAFYTAYLDLTNTDKIKKEYPKRFMDITEFLLDRMRRDNKHKLKEIQEELELVYHIDMSEIFDINEEDKKNYWYKGRVELKDKCVFLYLTKNLDINSDVNQYIFRKFKNKFRSHYGFTTKDKEKCKEMMDNITLFNDGENCVLKINPTFGIKPQRMLYDVYEIYEDTYRLSLNKFMKSKGEKAQEFLKDKVNTRKKDINKLGRMKANKKKYEDLNKIALPLDISGIPEFVLRFINVTPILTQTSNLISPVVSSLNLVTLRDSNERRHVTNVIDYY